ncbi:four helix bundle protein [Candidatus Daviesbacteria bacterium]|nr:four helix bundle protein [Candidatus Daviesbacteria bacterium]
MRNDKGYRKLIAWQKANLLVHLVYDITTNFPKDELFSLTAQMRRAALSVCANIAEGYSRKGSKDRRHFYQMAIASLTELEFFIDFAYERKFIKRHDYEKVLEVHTEAARVLNGLSKST